MSMFVYFSDFILWNCQTSTRAGWFKSTKVLPDIVPESWGSKILNLHEAFFLYRSPQLLYVVRTTENISFGLSSCYQLELKWTFGDSQAVQWLGPCTYTCGAQVWTLRRLLRSWNSCEMAEKKKEQKRILTLQISAQKTHRHITLMPFLITLSKANHVALPNFVQKKTIPLCSRRITRSIAIIMTT